MKRSDFGSKLDHDLKVVLDDGRTVTAEEAVTAGPPSVEMTAFAQRILDTADSLGAEFPDVSPDFDLERPGGLRVRWGGALTPSRLAESVGPIPAWVTLWHDTEPDFRFMAYTKAIQ